MSIEVKRQDDYIRFSVERKTATSKIDLELNPKILELKKQLQETYKELDNLSAKYRIKTDTNRVYLDEVREVVSRVVGITEDELVGKWSKKPCPDARKIYSLIANKHTNYSLSVIGQGINRDHSSVIAQLKAGNDLLGWDKQFTKDYDLVVEKLGICKI
jgi:chromosomal replication initiation ATPase DnaA